MTKAHWRQWMEQWRQAGPELEAIRRKELRSKPYDFASADALLEIADIHGRSRPTSGMVEMQRLFLKLAQKQGLVPATVREAAAEYRPRIKRRRRSGSRSR